MTPLLLLGGEGGSSSGEVVGRAVAHTCSAQLLLGHGIWGQSGWLDPLSFPVCKMGMTPTSQLGSKDCMREWPRSRTDSGHVTWYLTSPHPFLPACPLFQAL